ncbi:MAG TPA: GNAT family protein, partial [Candidatus Acidoferrum sp.]|nr:GNAT family protein [Candidatus Acidoferrum sp.]
DALHAGLHRCQLGIGIEGPWRRQGLGERLMQTAIAFAREQPSLQWISLSTFAGNTAARALYQRLGFVEEGVLRDRFRLGGQVIDDVQMILSVA